jgi:glutathione synthase/RimK-type ligase-like ATP-grasp enzyme
VRLALLTCEKYASLYEDDRLLAAELTRRGVEVVARLWTLGVPGDVDAILMRSPWDWPGARERFRAFLRELERAPQPVFNTPAVMSDYADKAYLPRLEARGVRVVPTEAFDATELGRLPQRVATHGWRRVVVKPAFTANAIGARVVEAEALPSLVGELSAQPGLWLTQPYVESIAEGELSFVFFDGDFSHAVRKQPAAGEWRVQHDYGGAALPVNVSAAWVDEAAAILRAAAPGELYARVDCVLLDGALHLMELELVEPELFFRVDAAAAARFADALLRRLG